MTNLDSAPSTPMDACSTANELYEKCLGLAGNLWWSWNSEVAAIFRDLDPVRWRELNHNPIALLQEFTPQRLAARANEMVLYNKKRILSFHEVKKLQHIAWKLSKLILKSNYSN